MPSMPNCKKPCKDCPFRRDCLQGWLGAERITEIIKQDSFVCHKKNHLQCAGHMLLNGEENGFVRLAKRMGIAIDLSGKELIFHSKVNCIEHHR